jgi:hypothetical protein
MNTRVKAQEIFNQHLALASTDGRGFRKAVMDQLMLEMGVTLASAATHYNNCKKEASIDGLGRPAASGNVRKPGSNKAKPDAVQDDGECFTVIELLKHEDSTTVGRCRSHLMQGDASEEFDDRIKYRPSNTWIMIQGLGPLHGETFKLTGSEKEIKRYTPEKEAVVVKDEPLLVD